MNNKAIKPDLLAYKDASFAIPDWQKELGKEELKNIENGNTELVDWEEARKQFRLTTFDSHLRLK